MLEIDKKATLSSNDNIERLILKTRYLVCINFTFDLCAISNNSSFSSHFCVRKEEIQTFINLMQNMIFNKKGYAELYDNDSDGYIRLVVDKKGEFESRSQLGGSHEKNIFTRFKVTEKAIRKFSDGLNDNINYCELKPFVSIQ